MANENLVMTLLVRDEEDILATNIEYHLAQGVDFIIATDNLSVDKTPEILLQYQNMGVLKIINESTDDYSQHRWVTRMARMACTDFDAKWVINNDADEFWWPENGENLKTSLNSLPVDMLAVKAERYNFLPNLETEHSYFLNSMTTREISSLNPLGTAPLPPKTCHRAYPDVEIGQGNHNVFCQGKLLATSAAPLSILHFPLRSYSQFANKIAKGGAAYARNKQFKESVGLTWRKLYQQYQEGKLYDYYLAQLPSAAKISDGMATGELVTDYRLRDFMTGVQRLV